MSIMLTSQADILVIASSDRDFSHLATHLTERGHTVIGIGERKAPAHFRKSCTTFHELTETSSAPKPPVQPKLKPEDLVVRVRDVIASEPGGMLITLLSTRMAKNNAVQISGTAYKTWRKLLTDFPGLFDCNPKGPDARVQLRA